MTPLGTAHGLFSDIVEFAVSPQACGYFASLLVFATFWMQRMVPLRVVAICSNVAFFTYAVRLGLAPIAILHAGLLPVNIWRLRQRMRPTCSTPSRRPASRHLAEGTMAVALSLLFIGGAASEVADGGVHCRVERWRDWSPSCRALAGRAVTMAAKPGTARTVEPNAATEHPSVGEVQQMVRAARTNPLGHRDALMIEMFYRMHMHEDVLLRLRWNDVGPGASLRVRHSARGNAARYALTAGEVRALAALRRTAAVRSPYVFAAMDGRPVPKRRFADTLARAAREAGIDRPS